MRRKNSSLMHLRLLCRDDTVVGSVVDRLLTVHELLFRARADMQSKESPAWHKLPPCNETARSRDIQTMTAFLIQLYHQST